MNAAELLGAVRAADDRDAEVARLRPRFAGLDEAHEALREELSRLLLAGWDAGDRPLLRALVAAETERAREDGGCGEALLAFCYLLYRIGEPEDVFLVYDAKYADMDCGVMIDGRFLTLGRPAQEMLAFVDARLAADAGLGDGRRHLRRDLVDEQTSSSYASEAAFRASVERYVGMP
jgi:hypothetical protein